MSATTLKEMEKFLDDFPVAIHDGRDSLFRFYKYDENRIERLSQLFIEKKIYHPYPEQLNDPFECKPHYKLPTKPAIRKNLRKQIIKTAINNGKTRKDAESLAAINMKKPEVVESIITKAVHDNLNKARICSYTASKENLLFWSYYADSHKGFCVEFDTSNFPIGLANKVDYKDDYPIVNYPYKDNTELFRIILTKSKIWVHEDEYRTVFIPGAESAIKNDGQSAILEGDEIINVYFGANMEDEHKETIVNIINKGPFNPIISNASISKSSFKLTFEKYKK